MAKTPMFTISTEGSVVTAKSNHGEFVSVDTAKLPQAQRDAALPAGVSAWLRVSYANAENAADGLKALQKRAQELLSGKWLPGTRSSEPKEPDDLARAVMEAVKIDFHNYENTFLPNWFAGAKYANGQPIVSFSTASDGKARMKGKADALRALSQHPNVAPIVARLAAERARTHAKDKHPSLATFTNSNPGASGTAEAAE